MLITVVAGRARRRCCSAPRPRWPAHLPHRTSSTAKVQALVGCRLPRARPRPAGSPTTTTGRRRRHPAVTAAGTLTGDLVPPDRPDGTLIAEHDGRATSTRSSASTSSPTLGDGRPPTGTRTTSSVPGSATYRVHGRHARAAITDRRRACPTSDVDDTVSSLVGLGGCSLVLAGIGGGRRRRRRRRTPPAAAAARGRGHRAHTSPSCRWPPARSSSPSGCPTSSPTSAPRSARSAPRSTRCSPTSSRRWTARHRSEQQVRQFVADASHELRTPLTTIAGYTELARRRPDDPATVRHRAGQGRGGVGADDRAGRGPAAARPPRRRPAAGPRSRST